VHSKSHGIVLRRGRGQLTHKLRTRRGFSERPACVWSAEGYFSLMQMKSQRWSFVTAACLLLAFFRLGQVASILAADAAADPMPVKSHWRGTQEADVSHSGTHALHCQLVVKDRDGDRFKAVYSVNGDSVRVEGVLASDGAFECTPIEVLKGVWESGILKDKWTGLIDGDKLAFDRPISENGGKRRSILTRVSGKADAG
jgi:hypothetical protein